LIVHGHICLGEAVVDIRDIHQKVQ